MKSQIKLSDHFGFGRLLTYTLPSIIMLIFTSVYGVVDGVFVSSFTGKTEFAAVNFMYPFLMVLGAVGFMIGSGGSALIAKTLGEGNGEKANRLFSMFVTVTVIIGVTFAVVAFFSILASSFFTALNNGVVSAVISFMRTLVFQIAAVFLLPLIMGVDGIWFSLIASEVLATAVSAIFLFANRKKYGY